jgi:thiol-disulfide isomerase/thioredoxin
MRLSVLVAALAGAASLHAGVAWRNVDAEHYLAGRKASEGYLQGKVVLVDRWGLGCPPCRRLLPRVEEIWRSFRTKPFVVIGGHCKGWGDAAGIQKLAKDLGLTYSIYEDAGLADGEPQFSGIPFLYVVDETGKVVYRGHDERSATQAVVTAITDQEAPKNLEQWKRFLDFELENLPGRAYLRLGEFKKKFPAEAKEYAEREKELKAVPEVKKLAELVDFAKKAKDMRDFGAKKKAQKQKYEKLVKDAISSAKYNSLLESKDPRVVQEAKNSIADLKWTAAEF